MAQTISKKAGSKVGLAFGLVAIVHSLIVMAVPWFFPASADQALFMLFWNTSFIFTGVLSGLAFEITRVVAAANAVPTEVITPSTSHHKASHPNVTASQPIAQTNRPRVVWLAGAIGLALLAALAITSPLWGPVVFPAQALPLAVLVGVVAFAFACDQGFSGALMGLRNWNIYSAIMASTVFVRLIVVVGVALLTRSVLATSIAVMASFFVWLGFLVFSKDFRALLKQRSDENLRITLSRIGFSALGTGLAALLGVGLPTLLSATSPAAEVATANVLFLAITLTRAPLMLPLAGIQGIVVSHYAAAPDHGLRAIRKLLLIPVAVGAAVTLGAWLLGPFLLTLIWGPDFWVPGAILGGLSIGTTGLAILTLTGAICQATKRHRAFLSGWAVAVAVAIGALLLPFPMAQRAVAALIAGPALGVLVHFWALIRRVPGAMPDGEAVLDGETVPDGELMAQA